MLKIAISGRAGSGKNTIASMIVKDILSLNADEYRIAAFAEPIKQIIEIMFPGCDLDSLYGPSDQRQNKIASSINDYIDDVEVTYRQASMDIGKLGRAYGSKFWVAHMANKYNSSPKNLKAFITSDLRFPWEFQWLKDNGFIICRVKRDNLLKIDDISETGQDALKDEIFDFIIDNNQNFDHLKKQVVDIFSKIR